MWTKARGRWFLFIQKWCLHIRMKWWCISTRGYAFSHDIRVLLQEMVFWRLRWFIQALATVPMITRWSTVYAYAVHHRIIRWHCSPVSSYFPPLMMFMEWSVGWSFLSSFHPVHSILSSKAYWSSPAGWFIAFWSIDHLVYDPAWVLTLCVLGSWPNLDLASLI